MSTTHLVRAGRDHRYAGLAILVTEVQEVAIGRATYRRDAISDWRTIVPWSAVPQVAVDAQMRQVSWQQAAADWLQTAHEGARRVTRTLITEGSV